MRKVLLLTVLALGISAFVMLQIVNKKHDIDLTLDIRPGQGISSIATRLSDMGAISSNLLFKLIAKLDGYDSKIQSGIHHIKGSFTMSELASMLASGEFVDTNERGMTIIEGWDYRDLDEYFVEQGIMTEEEFVKEFENPSKYREQFSFIDSRAITLEGYLFPDTYRIFQDATPEDVFVTLLTGYENKALDALAGSAQPYADLILASIIEKELSGYEEQQMAADLFARRMNEGIALQVDASVNYITGNDVLRNTLDDIAIDDPYNTYKYQGLPPGPISNPSLQALQAVRNPKPNSYYFYLTDKAGNVHWAETFDGHVRNKNQYLNCQDC